MYWPEEREEVKKTGEGLVLWGRWQSSSSPGSCLLRMALGPGTSTAESSGTLTRAKKETWFEAPGRGKNSGAVS